MPLHVAYWMELYGGVCGEYLGDWPFDVDH